MKITRLCDVGMHSHCDTALGTCGDATVSRCWSIRLSAEAHKPTARPGKAQLVCSTGLRKEREGAPPAVGLQVRTLTLHATGTRVPDTVLCSAVGSCTLGESEARDPLVEEPRGWIAQGALAVTPLGKGRAAKNAAECDSQRAPRAKKRVCAVQAHSDTTALDTRWHSHSSSPLFTVHTECETESHESSFFHFTCSRVSSFFLSSFLSSFLPLGYAVQSRRDVLRRTFFRMSQSAFLIR